MYEKNKLGSVIKKLREHMNISQAQLAELIGKSTGTVGQFERGEIFPSYETLYKIIVFFDVDANIFFSREKDQSPADALLMKNLFSQMKESEKNTIIKFHQELLWSLTLINTPDN